MAPLSLQHFLILVLDQCSVQGWCSQLCLRTVIAVDCYYPNIINGHLIKERKEDKKNFCFCLLLYIFLGFSPPPPL